ncbi:NADH pyrophosphatase [Lutibaculum baratangense AMV1]|uniref:NAD(+) diphosphatase n=2 Tax=Lutibaculum TaxID=1358438 RepID=V4R0L9_9HYPH|nr:NADH pyrophosphatase [Lutibaculum baratangense AMV1]
MTDDRALLRLDGEGFGLLFSRSEAEALGASPADPLLLGHDDEGPVFALPVPEEPPQETIKAIDARSIAVQGLLPPDLLGVVAQAKSLLDWHRRHGYCGTCGHPTRFADFGYRRDCGHCGAKHFPRTDPVVIMLVTHGEACLLAHEPRFAENMVSTLAGFLEPGETIEDAVRREVVEETGVEVGRVTYHASQPWPFPSSLMIGCLAEAKGRELTIDPAEIAWARWFSREDVTRMIAKEHPEGIFVPPPTAIAHQLMRHFAEGD